MYRHLNLKSVQYLVFFFKQTTAYEMRISDWSSDVCSSDLEARCEMVDDSHLQWAAFNAFGDGQMGRWRTEDRIEIKVSDGQLQVDVDQSGVMKKNESFSLKSLS